MAAGFQAEKDGRTLTGAWIETGYSSGSSTTKGVAPSRVRGLKLQTLMWNSLGYESHPHGCVD